MGDAERKREFGLFVIGEQDPKQTWMGDSIKLADKDKVEISLIDGYGGTPKVVAIISLDKGQNVSEIFDDYDDDNNNNGSENNNQNAAE